MPPITMRHIIHKLICWYLRRCAGAFHCYAYGEAGRYVVLMDENCYHDFQKRARWAAVPSTTSPDPIGVNRPDLP